MRNISVVQTAESSWVPSGPYGLDMHCIYTHTGTKELSLLPVTPDRARNPSKNNRTHPKTLDLLSSTPRIMWFDVISLRSITLHNPHYWISSWRALFSSTPLFTSVYIRRYECISSPINPPCVKWFTFFQKEKQEFELDLLCSHSLLPRPFLLMSTAVSQSVRMISHIQTTTLPRIRSSEASPDLHIRSEIAVASRFQSRMDMVRRPAQAHFPVVFSYQDMEVAESRVPATSSCPNGTRILARSMSAGLGWAGWLTYLSRTDPSGGVGGWDVGEIKLPAHHLLERKRHVLCEGKCTSSCDLEATRCSKDKHKWMLL